MVKIIPIVIREHILLLRSRRIFRTRRHGNAPLRLSLVPPLYNNTIIILFLYACTQPYIPTHKSWRALYNSEPWRQVRSVMYGCVRTLY